MTVLLILVVLAASLAAATLSTMTWLNVRDGGREGDSELLTRLARLEAATDKSVPALRDEVRGLREELRNILEANDRSQEARFSGFRHEASEGRRIQKESLDSVGLNIKALMESNDKRQDAIRETLTGSLDQLRKDNETKLEQMRLTVDEKLQGTLEKRLGESFQIVSERLEMVHKGLGEMQNLATGVGDLKRVLTNVKSRGGWGEVQLGMLLEDMLTPEQYERNVRIRPDSNECVEYAVRMPGRGDDGSRVYLPIDAKFPHEDYERLLATQETGVADEVERAGAALERAVRLQAKTICGKYVHPPYSTDCAIMYLPTEGLFAEVIRRPGLMSELQNQHRVMVTGPTTLGALLSSLQMGFRSLAIEKRSSEVWKVLGAAKAEFANYSRVWEKVSKKLDEAKSTVEQAGVRTRVIERKLRGVEGAETIEAPEPTPQLLAFPGGLDDEAAA